MKEDKMSRRNFIAAGAMAATTAFAGFPYVNKTYGKNEDKIRIGLIGCGKRGRGAVENALSSAPNIHLAALADPFQDRIDDTIKVLGDPKVRKREPLPTLDLTKVETFSGLDCHKGVLEMDIDYVLLCEPPGIRPSHFAAAIDAGKNVFMEKPVATDPVGVRKILKAGRKAKEKGLSVCVGFDNRHRKSTIETIKRIHDGKIGDVVGGQCYFNTGFLGGLKKGLLIEPSWSEMEYHLRNWYYHCWLSGDHIVEQHIHNLDVMNWVMNGYPIKATGTGGRQVRTGSQFGNIYDHFVIDYEYADDVHVMSMCRQWHGCDKKVGEFVTGTKGKSDPRNEITGPNAWKFEGEMVTPKVYEHYELIESIRNNKPMNQAEIGAYSTLTAIMGRESAYTGKAVKWEEMLNSDLDLFPEKMEFGPVRNRAVPVPGQPRPM